MQVNDDLGCQLYFERNGAHVYSNFGISATFAGSFDDGGDRLLQVLCQNKTIDLLDDGVCGTDKERTFEPVQ